MLKKFIFLSIFSILNTSSFSYAMNNDKDDKKVVSKPQPQPPSKGRQGDSNGGIQTGQSNVTVNKDVSCLNQ